MSLGAIQKKIQSFGNIKKITAALKLVSAAKLAKANRLLQNVRPFGHGMLSFYKHYTRVQMLDPIFDRLMVVVSSDRGMCGGIHTAVVKAVKQELLKNDKNQAKIVCVGQKAELLLRKTFKSNILFTAFKLGKDNPTFIDASKIFHECTYVDYTACQIFHNTSITKTTSKVEFISIYNTDLLLTVTRIASLEDVEEEHLRSFIEFSTVSLLYFAIVENTVCEHAARMVAMDSATKNVTKLTDNLSLYYNRKRQSKITADLIDIVSGSQVISEK